jgi:hypothetical protein
MCYSLITYLVFSWVLIIPIPSWLCLFSSSGCRIPFRIFCSGGLWSCIVLVSVYHGRFLFLLQFWMIALLGKVSYGWSCFLLVIEIPHSMPLLLLRFLLRNLLLFRWIYLHTLFDFLVLCVNCFNYNMTWRGSILIKSVRCPRAFLHLNGHFFLKTWEIFSYYFVEYITYTSGLDFFSLFKAHDLKVWSLDGVTDFLHVPFTALSLLPKDSSIFFFFFYVSELKSFYFIF